MRGRSGVGTRNILGTSDLKFHPKYEGVGSLRSQAYMWDTTLESRSCHL